MWGSAFWVSAGTFDQLPGCWLTLQNKSVPRSQRGRLMFFSESPCLSYLTPADPWLPPFSVIPFEGPVGDSSHLEEVLNHNIFSGSSWECVVIKERGWRSSWRSVLLWPLHSVWSCCRIHSFPVYPARVARPDIYSIHTYILFFFLQLVRFSLTQDKT